MAIAVAFLEKSFRLLACINLQSNGQAVFLMLHKANCYSKFTHRQLKISMLAYRLKRVGYYLSN